MLLAYHCLHAPGSGVNEKQETVERAMVSHMILKPGMSRSYPRDSLYLSTMVYSFFLLIKVFNSSWKFWEFLEQSSTRLSMNICERVILFCVRVPVLSEQMHEVEPRVSTDSRFLTSTFFLAMRWAVKARETVTVARRPSGTLATMIPMANTRLVIMSYPW